MSEIGVKEGFVLESGSLTPGEMEQINRYTRREFAPEEVYTFSLVLCDNEVDRDYERFSVDALEKLQALFLGKTCILDHERKSFNQTARIYDTAVEQEPGRTTRAGEPYTRLTARAYLPRTPKNQETIELIESGILKEVSISCAVQRAVCSVCGETGCAHEKGQTYQGKLCVHILEEPTDAYECSFVAVPAQREAGVRKSFSEDWAGTLEKRLQEASRQGQGLSAYETRQLSKRLEELTRQAAFGAQYREELREKALRLGGIVQPRVPREVLKSALEGLSDEELVQLDRAYEEMAAEVLPIKPQLAPEAPRGSDTDVHAAFRI